LIPLNQLIPECLLALGGAFLLGNLAAYIRLRPAWRDAKSARGGQAVKRGAGSKTTAASPGRAARRPGETGNAGKPGQAGSAEATPGRTGPAEARRARSGGVKAAAGPRVGSSGRVSASVRKPTASESKLPSRARVLANVLVGLVISVAALATLIRG
jgi:hypothetical protein